MGERFLQQFFLTGNALLSSAGIPLSVGGLHPPKKEETRGVCSSIIKAKKLAWKALMEEAPNMDGI